VNWFEHPEAGAYLQSLWAEGDRYQGEEFANRMGAERISPDALLANSGPWSCFPRNDHALS